ncbi:hypothetical protein [Pandoraea pulmonicola]|uniref:hypothetical protein n=1 Tax=Pandoraea pulmonicola TaxID=93221 RepID=UPI00157BDD67|nr:hypothetical protein [Pandoraea pulmonicola]
MLIKPIYLSFHSEAEGDEYVRRLEAPLDAGIVPVEFTSANTASSHTLSDLMDTCVPTTVPSNMIM